MNWPALPSPSTPALGAALAEWRAAQPAAPLVRPRSGQERRAGCSQAQLAAALGVGRVTVARWEAGTQEPTPEARERIEALRTGGPEAVKRLAAKQARQQFQEASMFYVIQIDPDTRAVTVRSKHRSQEAAIAARDRRRAELRQGYGRFVAGCRVWTRTHFEAHQSLINEAPSLSAFAASLAEE